jgi:hypothetical protein
MRSRPWLTPPSRLAAIPFTWTIATPAPFARAGLHDETGIAVELQVDIMPGHLLASWGTDQPSCPLRRR